MVPRSWLQTDSDSREVAVGQVAKVGNLVLSRLKSENGRVPTVIMMNFIR